MNAQPLTIADICVATWVQGGPLTPTDMRDRVVLVEVFQVNCPGCFLYALPEAIRLYDRYRHQGLEVIAIATAFEDYDKNTLHNLRRLLQTGEVIGDTLRTLQQQQRLINGRLNWRIPFAVAMDKLTDRQPPTDDTSVLDYARNHVAGFDSLAETERVPVLDQVSRYLANKTRRAETFERFALAGTPSALLFERGGNLLDVSFGQQDHLRPLIETCLRNPN